MPGQIQVPGMFVLKPSHKGGEFMTKSAEFCQLVARAINHTTWNIPRIRDGDKWRNINNPHLVENPNRINGYDHFEDAIFRIERFLKQKGWLTEIADQKEKCHEHLYYQHYRLKCWK
jgi:hypothetical protein